MPEIPESDLDLIRRAREIPPTVTMATLRRLVGRDAEADNELVLHEAIGIAGILLAELADRYEQAKHELAELADRLERLGGS
jgi:hypothetical protein